MLPTSDKVGILSLVALCDLQLIAPESSDLAKESRKEASFSINNRAWTCSTEHTTPMHAFTFAPDSLNRNTKYISNKERETLVIALTSAHTHTHTHTHTPV